MHPFDVDTAVGDVRAGVCSARISDRWYTLNGTPNGGYLLAMCLRALQQLTDREPLIASGMFLRPAKSGPAELRLEPVRTGRRLTTAQARLMQGEQEVVRAIAAFGGQMPDAGVIVAAPPPNLGPPESLLSSAGVDLPGVSVLDRVEYRVKDVPGFVRGAPSGVPFLEFWVRFREPRAPDLLSLVFFVDAFPPIAVETGHLSSTVSLSVYLRAKPASGWLACRIRARLVGFGVHDQELDIWDSSGDLVAQGRQLAAIVV